MDLSKPLPHFTVERFSHHFVVKRMSPMGQKVAEAFARNFIQFGMVRHGRIYRRDALRVFATMVKGDTNEVRFHVGQWEAWKTHLADRGVSPSAYTEVEYGFAEPEPLNAKILAGWKALDYQEPIIEYLQSPLPSARKLVEIQTGKGKSQPGYAKVRTSSGWKRMDEIVVGDMVLCHDGSFSRVKEVYENGLRPTQRVILEDGRSTDADKEHLWRINYYQQGKLTSCLVNTDHIRVLLKENKRVWLPLIEPDKTIVSVVDEDLSLAEDVFENTDRMQDLLSLEMQPFFARTLFIRQLLKHAELNVDEGTVFLPMKEANDQLEQVFRSCGFIITYSGEDKIGYSLWHADITAFFDEEDHDQLRTIGDVRGPFYGVEITQVEKLEDEELSFCILIEHPVHLYVTDGYIVTHNTFCASSAIANLGHRMVAFLRPKYIDKWKGDLKELLGIEEDEIEEIRGSASLMKVMAKAREGTLNCKAILVSNKTYQHYITKYEEEGTALLDQGYDCLPHEFIQLTGCGVRLVDEVHDDFHLNFKIDLYTHVQWAISLSATLVSDDPFISRMHNIAYDPDIRYNGLAYDKYVKSYALLYHINGGQYLRVSDMGKDGSYSHMAFEKNFFKNKKLLDGYLNLIDERMQIRYLKRKTQDGQKCLIYASSIQMCTLICEYLKKKYPNLDVRRYVEDDPYDNLMNADICVSTIGSAGTGHDIKKLIAVILTVSISSKASNIQGFGRLRKLDGIDVEFEYFSCIEIPKQMTYYTRKEQLLANMALTTETITLPYALG